MILGIPLDPDVADYMGAFPEEAITLADMVEDGLLTITNSGEVIYVANTKKHKRENARRFYRRVLRARSLSAFRKESAPWQVPWTLGKSSLVPHNPVSGTVYRGMNRCIWRFPAMTTRAG